MAVSPDSKHLFVPGARGVVEVWDLAQGKKVRDFEGVGGNPMTISADGKYLFSGGQKLTSVAAMVRMYDVATGKLLWQIQEHICHVSVVAFSPNGKHVMSAGDSAFLYIHEIETGKVVQSLQVGADKNRDYPRWSAAFDKIGKHVLVGNGDGVKLWNLESGAVVAKFGADPKYIAPPGGPKWYLLPDGAM